MQEKVSLVGELLKSFPQAASAVDQLLDMAIGRMRFGRVTERHGDERVTERDVDTEQVTQLRLMDKIAGPVGVTPPVVGAVMADGGRFQQNIAQPDSGQHWYEYQAGLCLTLGSLLDADDTTAPQGDPCPQVPLSLLNFEHVETLTREIAQRAASSSRSLPDELRPAETGVLLEELRAQTQFDDILIAAEKVVREDQRSPRELPFSPKIKSREVVATTGNAAEFGRLLVARAWRSGLFQAQRKGFVADGGSWLWTLFVTAFQPFEFEGILDIIHAVTHVFAAAMADRTRAAGWIIYRRWITWIWQGQVSRVIEELQARAQELGQPTDTDKETSPRRIIAGAPSGSADVLAKPPAVHELSTLPRTRLAPHQQRHGVDHEGVELPSQRDRKVLEPTRSRSPPATPSRSPERQPALNDVLENPPANPHRPLRPITPNQNSQTLFCTLMPEPNDVDCVLLIGAGFPTITRPNKKSWPVYRFCK